MSILDVKETLSDNLSGKKIGDILNLLMYEAINPLCTTTSVVKCYVASILFQTAQDNRRKVSTLPKQECVDFLFNAVIQPKNKTASLIKRSRLERGIQSKIVEEIHNSLSTYDSVLEVKKKRTLEANRDLVKTGAKLSRIGAALSWSKAYYKEYISFRNMLMEKYVRFAWNLSQRSKFETSLTIDSEELHANYMLAVAKAIDRYDPDKGPLTACIRWWIQEAKIDPKFSHVYGQSYDLSADARKQMSDSSQSSFSEEIDDKTDSISKDSILQRMEDAEDVSNLLKFLCKTNGTKIARVLYEIPYVLNEDEKAALLNSTKR